MIFSENRFPLFGIMLYGRHVIRAPTMAKLITASQFPNPDAAYEALVDARRGLSDEASAELDAKLLLILANHIGDLAVLEEAIALAKR